MNRKTIVLCAGYILTQIAALGQSGGSTPKFYEAEEFPSKYARTEVDDGASEGVYVTAPRFDAKFYSLANVPIPPDWKQVGIWVRIRDCAVQLKTKDEQGARRELKVARDSSSGAWTWYNLGNYQRDELGEFIRFVRIPGGTGGLDAIFLDENSSIDPGTVSDFSKYKTESSK